MTAIDAVRARLQRDLSLRLIHRDTAGDVQALLDHHAKLQAASSDVVLAVDVAMAALEPWLDHGSDEDAPQMASEALADGFRKAGLFTAAAADGPVIDLEPFRPAVEAFRAANVAAERASGPGYPSVRFQQQARECDRLEAMIDGQPTKGEGVAHD